MALGASALHEPSNLNKIDVKKNLTPGLASITALLALFPAPTMALTWDTVTGDGAPVTAGSGAWETTAGNITESGKPLAKVKDVKLLHVEGGRAVLAVGSGTYRFSAPATTEFAKQ